MGKMLTYRMFDRYPDVRNWWSKVTLPGVYPRVTFEHSFVQKFFSTCPTIWITFDAQICSFCLCFDPVTQLAKQNVLLELLDSTRPLRSLRRMLTLCFAPKLSLSWLPQVQDDRLLELATLIRQYLIFALKSYDNKLKISNLDVHLRLRNDFLNENKKFENCT